MPTSRLRLYWLVPSSCLRLQSRVPSSYLRLHEFALHDRAQQVTLVTTSPNAVPLAYEHRVHDSLLLGDSIIDTGLGACCAEYSNEVVWRHIGRTY